MIVVMMVEMMMVTVLEARGTTPPIPVTVTPACRRRVLNRVLLALSQEWLLVGDYALSVEQLPRTCARVHTQLLARS